MRLIIVLLSCYLSACSSYRSSFDCPAETGVGCKSISQINQDINQGNLYDSSKTKVKSKKISVKPRLPFPQVIPNILHNNKVSRLPESVIRIWIAPRLAKDGSYQEAQYIHEVLEQGRWHRRHK